MNYSSMDRVMEELYLMVSSHFSAAFPEVDVLDGPSIDDIGLDVVAIGISADDMSIESAQELAGLDSQRETYDLICLVRSWNGDPEMAARRSRAFELFRAIAELIKRDPRLRGACTYARIAGISYAPARLPEGAVASLTFRVRVEAFTS